MSRFLTGISGDLEEDCRDAMFHDSMDLANLMVHVHQVDENRRKRGVCKVRSPKPSDKVGPSNSGGRNNFGVR